MYVHSLLCSALQQKASERPLTSEERFGRERSRLVCVCFSGDGVKVREVTVSLCRFCGSRWQAVRSERVRPEARGLII